MKTVNNMFQSADRSESEKSVSKYKNRKCVEIFVKKECKKVGNTIMTFNYGK